MCLTSKAPHNASRPLQYHCNSQCKPPFALSLTVRATCTAFAALRVRTSQVGELSARQQAEEAQREKQASDISALMSEAMGLGEAADGSAAGSAIDAARRKQQAPTPQQEAAMAEARRVAAGVVASGGSVSDAVKAAENAASAVEKAHVAARRKASELAKGGASPEVAMAVELATREALLLDASDEGLATAAVQAAANAARAAAEGGARPAECAEAASAAWRITYHSDLGQGYSTAEAAQAAASAALSFAASGASLEHVETAVDAIGMMVNDGVGGVELEIAHAIAVQLAESGQLNSADDLKKACRLRAAAVDEASRRAESSALEMGASGVAVEAARAVARRAMGCQVDAVVRAAGGIAQAFNASPPSSQEEMDAGVSAVVSLLRALSYAT